MGIFWNRICMVIINYDSPTNKDIEEFRNTMDEEIKHLLVGPIHMVNFTKCWFFAPDGSKFGWDHSNKAQEARQKFSDMCNEKAWVRWYSDGDYGEYVTDGDGKTIMEDEESKYWSNY